MDFFFDCPSCNGSLVADDRCVGESMACPHCSKWILIPASGSPPHVSPQKEGTKSHTENLTLPHSPENGIPSQRMMDPILVKELQEIRVKYRKLKEDHEELKSEVKESKTESLTKQLADLTLDRDALVSKLEVCRLKLHKIRNEQQVAMAVTDQMERDFKTTIEALKLELTQTHRELNPQPDGEMKATLSRVELHLMNALAEIKLRIRN